jgi:DNA-binding response OmpR family regulator
MSVSSSDLSSSAAPSDDPQRASDPLLGRRLLIVEDDPYIALALEETLSEFGLIIAGMARSVEEAVRLSREDGVELALLDVNIGHERIDPVADALAARGCPFIFTTGCGRAGLPEAHLEHAMVEKPFYVEEILSALRNEMERAQQR